MGSLPAKFSVFIRLNTVLARSSSRSNAIVVAPFAVLHLPLQEVAGRRLQLSKKPLSQDQKVTDVSSFVETDPDKLLADAKGWATALLKRAKAVSGGKNDVAMNTAARWAGVTPNMFWKLRYRPPNDVGVSTYNRLKLAHFKHCEAVESDIAENLVALRGLPSTPARERLMAQMAEYLRASESQETRAVAERANTTSAGRT
jgi:hypothetical protein